MRREARQARVWWLALVAVASAVAALLFVAGPGLAAVTHTTKQSRCERASSTTLLKTRRVRIFATPKDSVTLPSENFQTIAGRPIYACLERTGKSWLLNLPGEKRAIWLGVDEHALAIHAPLVAYAFTAYYLDTHATFIQVRDLRSGAIIRSCSAGGGQAPFRTPHISKIVLSGKGSVAWSADEDRYAYGNAVTACDSTGQRTLDSGEGIDLESLSLQHSVVSWLNADIQREAWLE